MNRLWIAPSERAEPDYSDIGSPVSGPSILDDLPGGDPRYPKERSHEEASRGRLTMNEEQIKHMVDRFLSWRLPENFNPDAGISFKKMFNEQTAHPMKHEPIGTNLFDATQTDVMVRHMIDGMPPSTVG